MSEKGVLWISTREPGLRANLLTKKAASSAQQLAAGAGACGLSV